MDVDLGLNLGIVADGFIECDTEQRLAGVSRHCHEQVVIKCWEGVVARVKHG